MKLSFASLLATAASAFGFLAAHDTTGTLSNPSSSLQDKAAVLEPTIAAAGTDIVEQGLIAKLGPDASALIEFAEPLLRQVMAACEAKIVALTPTAAPAQG